MQDINELHKDAPIAVYLRKSRLEDGNDADETLRRHKKDIEDFIEIHGFKNVTFFEEVVSGERIRLRPKMLELLDLVSEGKFRFVIAVHLDRLTRGDMLDRAILVQAFKESDTLLYTTSNLKTYNFNDDTNDNSQVLTEIEMLFASMEYKTIKRRLQEGQLRSFEEGNTLGKPPFAYIKDRNTNEILIDENKANIYLWIVDKYLHHGYSSSRIARELNAQGIEPPSGRKSAQWSHHVILSILKNPYYTGEVVRNKSKTRIDDESGKLIRKMHHPTEYITTEGNHEALISKDTYQAILSRMEANRKVPPATLARTNKLSGLVRCLKCGYGLGIRSKTNVRGEYYGAIRNCTAPLKDGSLCNGTRGIREEIIVEALRLDMTRYKEELFTEREITPVDAPTLDVDPQALQEARIAKSEGIIERSKKLYVLGDMTFEEYESMKQAQEKDIEEAIEEIERLKDSPEAEQEERRRAWDSFDLEAIFFDKLPKEEFNRIIRTLVKSIHIRYTKSEELDVKIEYL